VGLDNHEPESPSDSLRDIKDISLNLKFSLDGEKFQDGEILGNDVGSERKAVNDKRKLENAVLSWSKGVQKDAQKTVSADKVDQATNAGRYPAFRKRKYLYVIAVDGDLDGLSGIFQNIFDAATKPKIEGSIGFILSTSYSMPEIQSYLLKKGLNLHDFDAYICNSGSDMYYSSLNSEDSPIVADSDYHAHIEHRWGGEGLRKTLLRWADTFSENNGEHEEQVVIENEEVSSDYCFAFKIRNPEKVRLLLN